MTDGFHSFELPPADNLFEALLASVWFEELGPGRRGTVVVAPDGDRAPIVRTTTPYQRAATRFGALHDQLARAIRPDFNNALIEHYTRAYSTMKRHSDQALDLATGSSIAIYSCYRDPAHPSRRLVVKSKEPGSATEEILLAHHGVVMFSLDTNRRFTHTIALREGAPDTDWLGITFRTSKTFVHFDDGPVLDDGTLLSLATDDQRRELFALKRRENEEVDFAYPTIGYTLSPSDLVPPT